MEAFRMMELPSFISGNAFCTENKKTLHIDVDKQVKAFFGDMADGCQISDACIGEQNIDMAVFFFYGCIETVEVLHIRDITLDTDSFAAADFLECYVDLFLAAAGDDDMRAFSNKTHGGGEAHTAVAAGDHGDLAFEYLCHGCPHSPKGCCSKHSQLSNLSQGANLLRSLQASPSGLAGSARLVSHKL